MKMLQGWKKMNVPVENGFFLKAGFEGVWLHENTLFP